MRSNIFDESEIGRGPQLVDAIVPFVLGNNAVRGKALSEDGMLRGDVAGDSYDSSR